MQLEWSTGFGTAVVMAKVWASQRASATGMGMTSRASPSPAAADQVSRHPSHVASAKLGVSVTQLWELVRHCRSHPAAGAVYGANSRQLVILVEFSY